MSRQWRSKSDDTAGQAFTQEVAVQLEIKNEMIARLATILRRATRTDLAQITRGTRLRDELGLDSLSMIDVVVAAEDEFGVAIADEDAERFETVGDVVDHLEKAAHAA